MDHWRAALPDSYPGTVALRQFDSSKQIKV
jgi:hypothetical protein